MKLKKISAGLAPIVMTALLFPCSPAEAHIKSDFRYIEHGMDGGLLTEKELSCPMDYQESLTDNLLYIYKTKRALTENDVRVLVTLRPEKRLFFLEFLKENMQLTCHTTLYTTI